MDKDKSEYYDLAAIASSGLDNSDMAPLMALEHLLHSQQPPAVSDLTEKAINQSPILIDSTPACPMDTEDPNIERVAGAECNELEHIAVAALLANEPKAPNMATEQREIWVGPMPSEIDLNPHLRKSTTILGRLVSKLSLKRGGTNNG